MITTATTATASYVGAEESASLLILSPPPPLEERVHQLLSWIRNSSLFSEEEQEGLAIGEAQLQTNRNRALAYIQIHVVRSAIARWGEQIQRELFDREEELNSLLQESLPPEVNVEDFIEEFERIELEFERLCQNVERVQRRRDQLYAAANQVNAQIRAGAEELESAFASLQQKRIEAVDQITRAISSVATNLENEAEKATEIGRRTLEIAERMERDQRKLNGVSARAEAMLEGDK